MTVADGKLATGNLWISWGVMVAALAGVVLAADTIPASSSPTPEAQVAVYQFVTILLALVAGVGSLAVRENVTRPLWTGALDLRSASGRAFMQRMLLGAWLLCVVVAGIGAVLATLTGIPKLAWPFAICAVVLLGFHAPRRSMFQTDTDRR